MKKYVISAVAMAVVFLFVYALAARKLIEVRQENEELKYELAHATLPMQRDTIRDSIEVVTQTVVEVDRPELKRALDQERRLVRELQLKVRQLEAIQTTVVQTCDTVTAQYQESDSAFHYQDQWADIKLNLKDTTFYYNIRDSLATIVYREYKHRLLWWRWGTKGYQVKIVNFNPRAHVKYNRYIKSK